MIIRKSLFLLLAATTLSTTPIISCNRGTTAINIGEKEKNEHQTTKNISPDIPKSMNFAGASIDLTSQERRERMDREILSFSYSHINTILQIKRANRLFPIVEPILAAQGVPDDFKYLMIIECNGDVEAFSKAGAAGPWQFLEKTGREHGLEINGEIDERYNIEKATIAACKYLKESYKIFGDWLTAAASYNTGITNIKKRVTAQKEDKAIDLVLLPETSRYIFRLLAIKAIFSNPEAYGFTLRACDLYPTIPIAKSITISKSVGSWADFAKKHGLTYQQLHEANPWIRNTTLTNKNAKSYSVKIPDANKLKYDPNSTKAHDKRWVTE